MRRFGWKPEQVKPDNRLRWSRANLRLSNTPLPDTISLIVDIDLDILDQGGTSSCVAHAVPSAVQVCIAYAFCVLMQRRVRAAAFPLAARRWVYRLSRETHGDGDVDDGTFISAALYIMQKLGWPSEVWVPWSEADINAPMTANARHHASDQAGVVEEYAITSWGDSRKRQIKEALASGYPIVFGAYVDQPFKDCNDWTKQELLGTTLGGHAMVIVGYEDAGVHVLNSWGSGWGVGGIGLLSWDAACKRIRDLRVITLSKEPTS